MSRLAAAEVKRAALVGVRVGLGGNNGKVRQARLRTSDSGGSKEEKGANGGDKHDDGAQSELVKGGLVACNDGAHSCRAQIKIKAERKRVIALA